MHADKLLCCMHFPHTYMVWGEHAYGLRALAFACTTKHGIAVTPLTANP